MELSVYALFHDILGCHLCLGLFEKQHLVNPVFEQGVCLDSILGCECSCFNFQRKVFYVLSGLPKFFLSFREFVLRLGIVAAAFT